METVRLPFFLFEHLLSTRIVFQGEDGDFIDGVEHLDIVRRCEDGDSHEPVFGDSVCDIRLVKRELVGGECTGLIRTEDVNSGERFDGSQFLDDTLATGKVSCSNSHGRGRYAGKTNGDTNDLFVQSISQVRHERVRYV